MRRAAFGFVVLLIAVPLLADCPIEIPAGNHQVVLTSYYRHLFPQDGPDTWFSVSEVWYTGPAIARPASQPHPSGHQWTIDTLVVGGCGEYPGFENIFEDGFELGNTENWSRIKGE